jgi:hypothetical protein
VRTLAPLIFEMRPVTSFRRIGISLVSTRSARTPNLEERNRSGTSIAGH